MCYVRNNDNKQSGIRTYDNTWYSLSRNKEEEKQWGKYNIPIYTDKDCINVIESSTQREGFYIHGGESYGDNGGIDLAKEDTRFFKVLESIKEEYKEVLESIQDDKGRMVVRLEVGYGEEESEQLSKYFTISDVTKTNQKTTYFSNAQLIELNKKEAMILENYKKLKLLALHCDKIVDWIGYKPNINSGVRIDVVNENLPNSSKKGKSQHTKCEAFDLGFNSKADLKKVYLAIKNNEIPNLDNQVFSQVILEKFSSSKIGWLHIGLKTITWSRGTEFKISYDGSNYINFNDTQSMIDKF